MRGGSRSRIRGRLRYRRRSRGGSRIRRGRGRAGSRYRRRCSWNPRCHHQGLTSAILNGSAAVNRSVEMLVESMRMLTTNFENVDN